MCRSTRRARLSPASPPPRSSGWSTRERKQCSATPGAPGSARAQDVDARSAGRAVSVPPTSLSRGAGAYSPAMPSKDPTTVLDARAVERTLKRMADEIVELNAGTTDLVIVGIQRRGVQLAQRIVAMIEKAEEVQVPSGALDITLYRDDLQTVGPRPVVGPTNLPWAIDGKHVVIVDDVLYTGRTVRAALDELADFGRPKRIEIGRASCRERA